MHEQNGYVRHTLETLENAGIDVSSLLSKYGINRELLLADNDLLTHGEYSALLDDITARFPNLGLGLKDGQGVTVLEHGLLGYAMFASKNFTKAIERHTQYQDVIGAALQTRLCLDDTLAHLRVHNVARPELVNTAAKLRYETERLLAQWAEIGPAFGQSKQWYRRIDITYPAPIYADQYREVLGEAVHFGQPHTQITFHRDLLLEPLSFANESAAQLCEQQCEALMRHLKHSQGFTDKIRRLLANCRGVYPAIGETASALSMSERSLRRRLKDEGTTYKEVVLNFRMELSASYLKGNEISIQEVAYLAGYADPSNFHRAFCQHFGTTPAAFRAADQTL